MTRSTSNLRLSRAWLIGCVLVVLGLVGGAAFDPRPARPVVHRAGYRVLEAEDGARALAILESGVAVDLLFTDVVMPGPVSSRDLAATAKAAAPTIIMFFIPGSSF